MTLKKKHVLNAMILLSVVQAILLILFNLAVIKLNKSIVISAYEIKRSKRKIDSLQRIYNFLKTQTSSPVINSPTPLADSLVDYTKEKTKADEQSTKKTSKINKLKPNSIDTNPSPVPQSAASEPPPAVSTTKENASYKAEIPEQNCFTKIQCLSNIKLLIEVDKSDITNARLKVDYVDKYLKRAKTMNFLVVEARWLSDRIYIRFKEISTGDDSTSDFAPVNPLVRYPEFEGQITDKSITGQLTWRERLDDNVRTIKVKYPITLTL